MAPVDKSPSARPINFRVVLPASWNHRAVHRGGGGMNGVIPQLTDADLGPGYVRYGSDSGHQIVLRRPTWRAGGDARAAGAAGSENDWATNDEAIKNLAYMQLKKTHDAAFFIVERVYGERPRFSYFVGTSQGGREGLTVVQRYPADYDGVVSIVPIVNFTTLMLAPELIRIHEKPLANWVPAGKDRGDSRRVHAAVRQPGRPGRRRDQQLHGVPRDLRRDQRRTRPPSMGGQALPEQRRSQSGRHDDGGVSDGWTDLDARDDLQPVSFPGAAGARRQAVRHVAADDRAIGQRPARRRRGSRVRRARPRTRPSTRTSEFSA